ARMSAPQTKLLASEFESAVSCRGPLWVLLSARSSIKLVAYGEAITSPRIGGTQPHPGFFFDHDSLRIAEISRFGQFVMAVCQRSLRITREAIGFIHEFI